MSQYLEATMKKDLQKIRAGHFADCLCLICLLYKLNEQLKWSSGQGAR